MAVLQLAEFLQEGILNSTDSTIEAISKSIDERVVARYLEEHHGLEAFVGSLFSSLHTLSEQSYENKALTFGCILDTHSAGKGIASGFPADLLVSKKYKALSDGYQTAYHISRNGNVIGFVDLGKFETTPLTAKHYYPEWAERIARASRTGRCGIALSRQGEILVFDEGSLRFTYRYGRWQYWNHSHLVNLLRDRAKAQRVSRKIRGRVVSSIYRAALDVSFRRSGGLFVILRNRKLLRKLVQPGDAIGDQGRAEVDVQFDSVVRENTIQSLPRSVVVELSSLDGALVIDNSGRIKAYGAVLQPAEAGELPRSEGSRTKAAIGASNYGLAVKVSSDGGIAIYHLGKPFMSM